MRLVYFLFLILLISAGCIREASEQEEPAGTLSITIPSADDIGADEYGMKSYVMAFLYRGDATGIDSLRASELQKAHLENITRLAGEGLLVVAGPFLDSGDLRGIYIFNTDDMEIARGYTRSDPAITEGLLKMELKPWYGSAAMMMINPIHQKLAAKSVTE